MREKIKSFCLAIMFAAKVKLLGKENKKDFFTKFESIKHYFSSYNSSWISFRARWTLCYKCKGLGNCLQWPADCACAEYKGFIKGRPLTEDELYPWRKDPIWQQAMLNLEDECSGAPDFEAVGHEMSYLRSKL